MSARHTAIAALAGALLVAGSATGVTTTAAAAEDADAAAHAGAFLERELARGGHVFDYPGTEQADYGVTIDAVLALAATGTSPGEAAAATAAVEKHLDDYLGPSFGPTELYAGPVAKTALLTMTMGEDPQEFAGRDLLDDLADLQTPDGRYADRTAYTDTSNTFTQGLALTALVRAGEDPPPTGVDFLLDQQCGDGGFRLFVESPDCTSDPDATALATIALLALDQPAAAKGLDYLAGRMDADGGIGGGVGAESANTNSTGLAATAFAAGGRAAERERANAFVARLQLGCSAPAAARGAIAYDADAYAALVAAGADAQVSDQERRATSQAAFGLSGATLLNVSIDGATPGSDGCTGGPSSTSPPPSTTTPPPTTPPPTSPPVTSTTTVTTTVTAPAPPAPPPPAPVTVTVTEREQGTDAPAGDEQDSDEQDGDGGSDRSGTSSSTSPASTSSARSTPPPTGPLPAAGSPTAQAVAPAATPAGPNAADTTGSQRLPYLLAGGLVLLGAAAAAYILMRGRT